MKIEMIARARHHKKCAPTMSNFLVSMCKCRRDPFCPETIYLHKNHKLGVAITIITCLERLLVSRPINIT